MEAKTDTQEDGAKTPLSVCPHCGSYDIDPEGGLGRGEDGKMKTFPVCDNCSASAPSITIWNMRTPTTDMIRILRDNGLGHILDEPTMRMIVERMMKSDKDVAFMQELAELLGANTGQEYEELRATPRIDTELGYWENLHNGLWQHHRTADF